MNLYKDDGNYMRRISDVKNGMQAIQEKISQVSYNIRNRMSGCRLFNHEAKMSEITNSTVNIKTLWTMSCFRESKGGKFESEAYEMETIPELIETYEETCDWWRYLS